MYSSEYQKEWKLSKIIEGLNQIDKDHYLTELQVSSNFSRNLKTDLGKNRNVFNLKFN